MKNGPGNALKPGKLTYALMVTTWDLRANLTKVQARKANDRWGMWTVVGYFGTLVPMKEPENSD